MPLFAGVDGGGSKTLAIVVDEVGREVGRGLSENANYQVFKSQGLSEREAARLTVRHIAEAVARALPVGSSAPVAVFAGLAGVETLADADLLKDTLAEDSSDGSALKCEIVNDAELLLYGLAQTQGIGLIAGTGSVAVGRDAQGRRARAGGWGYLFGDEGSGYEIGKTALQLAAQSADGRGPQTLLLPAILEAWGLSRPEELIHAVYTQAEGRHQKIAQLATIVYNVAREGDKVAERLSKRAAFDLAVVAWAVYKQLDLTPYVFELALSGGLLLNMPDLKAGVLEHLGKLGCRPGNVVEIAEPAKAAALACLHSEKVSETP